MDLITYVILHYKGITHVIITVITLWLQHNYNYIMLHFCPLPYYLCLDRVLELFAHEPLLLLVTKTLVC